MLRLPRDSASTLGKPSSYCCQRVIDNILFIFIVVAVVAVTIVVDPKMFVVPLRTPTSLPLRSTLVAELVTAGASTNG